MLARPKGSLYVSYVKYCQDFENARLTNAKVDINPQIEFELRYFKFFVKKLKFSIINNFDYKCVNNHYRVLKLIIIHNFGVLNRNMLLVLSCKNDLLEKIEIQNGRHPEHH